MTAQRMLFIGAGRMAEAIFAGLLRQDSAEISEIIVANRSGGARLEALHSRYGVTVTREWQEYVSRVGTIVLAMPPEDHPEVLRNLAPHMDGQFVVTIAAGIGTGLLEELLPPGTPVAWVMPNTAAAIGASMSLYTYGQHVRDEHRRTLGLILDAIGVSERCTEEQIHNLTAVTGSAPAFVYALAEALEASARTYGISPEQARKLVGQMIAGSAAMLQQGASPAELRDQVTTPGGATAAGLRVLDSGNFADLLHNAVLATNQRAKELGGK